MHGPPNTYPPDPETGRAYFPVVWPNRRYITVLDTIAMELPPERATKWRELRDEALKMWENASGLRLPVQEWHAKFFPAFNPGIANEYDRLMSPIVPEVIRLIKVPLLQGTLVQAYAFFNHPGAWAGFKLGKRFWTFSTRRRRRYVVRHEIGHCLGLKDRYGLADLLLRRGVMATGLTPDAHDVESLRAYWGQ